jgi:hypothetical protein
MKKYSPFLLPRITLALMEELRVFESVLSGQWANNEWTFAFPVITNQIAMQYTV